MTLDEVRAFIRLCRRGDFDEVSLNDQHTRLRLRFKRPNLNQSQTCLEEAIDPRFRHALTLAEKYEAGRLIVVRSNLVGTFLDRGEADSEPYVAIGSEVVAKTVIGMIVTLGIRTEIRASSAGEIVAIYVSDGQPVQYGDILMAICR